MITFERVIENEVGLHARPATKLIKTARQFDSQIQIKDLDTGKTGDAKMLLSVLSMSITKGHTVRIDVSGEDEEEAVQSLNQLMDTDFE